MHTIRSNRCKTVKSSNKGNALNPMVPERLTRICTRQNELYARWKQFSSPRPSDAINWTGQRALTSNRQSEKSSVNSAHTEGAPSTKAFVSELQEKATIITEHKFYNIRGRNSAIGNLFAPKIILGVKHKTLCPVSAEDCLKYPLLR